MTYHWARQPDGNKLHAFALPFKDGITSACSTLHIALREHISSPQHNNQQHCKLCERIVEKENEAITKHAG
jgi:hypothetical protein